MEPGKKPFWLPLTLLAGFFVAIVMAGNLLFHAFRPPAASIPRDPQESIERLASREKRLQRRISRAVDRVVDAFTPEEEGEEGVPCPVPDTPTIPKGDPALPASTADGPLETPEPGPAPFAWPAPVSSETGVILPKTMSLGDWPTFRAQLVTDLYRQGDDEPVADVGDAFLKGPELLLDGLFICIAGLSPRSPLRTWEDEESRSVTARILDVQFAPRSQRLSTAFLQQWTESEKKYLGNFEESRANTFEFQYRTADANLDELARDQRKVFWDALRRTYFARYKMHSEERVRDEAWYFERWSGLDFALLPPFIGAYLFYRGLNKRLPLGDVALRIDFEPISEFTRRDHDRPVAAALEWTVKGFPVGIIVSAGIYNGRYGVDFAGIGTSVGAARRAVQAEHEAARR